MTNQPPNQQPQEPGHDRSGPDELFAHGLLGFVHHDTPERQRERVARAMDALHAADVVAVAGRVPGRRLRIGRWVSGLAASLIIAGGVYFATIKTELTAEAAVQQLITSSRSSGDRRYEVRITDRPDAPLPDKPTAVVDMRGTGGATYVLLQMQFPGKLLAGRDEKGEWVRRPDGNVLRDNPRGVWPRWAVVQTGQAADTANLTAPTANETFFVDSLDQLLDSLSKTFAMKDAGTSDGAVRHITGQRLREGPPGPMPDGVDIWIDRTNNQLDRIELRWEERQPRDGGRPEGDRPGPRGKRPEGRHPEDRRPEDRGPRQGPPRDGGPGGPREGHLPPPPLDGEPDGPRGEERDGPRPPLPPGFEGLGVKMFRPPPPRRLVIQRVDAPQGGFAAGWFGPEAHTAD